MPGLRIRVEEGELEGCKKVTADGLEYYCYNGIPYAKPPLGELRFQDPQNPEPWDGVRDAKNEGSICSQLDLFMTKDIVGSEDCLFINVNVPSSTSKYLAVMVYIHGGGFKMGSGNSAVQGADYFMRKDVILVTFNYRLGPLGFLSLKNRDVPGNAGLKDQILALKWIKRNIENFNGDPNNVTIFGQSSGAACVQFLMMSPSAKGLFNGAIMQSGSCINAWAVQNDPVSNVLNLAADLGFETNNKDDALNFLKNVPINDLITASYVVFSVPDQYCFLPVIEDVIEGVEAFLTKDPIKLIMSGDFNRVPCINGWNSVEGAIHLNNIFLKIEDFGRVENLLQLKVDFNDLVKKSVMLNNEKDVESFQIKIKEFYFKEDRNFIEGYVDMISDIYFTNSAILSGCLMSERSPVYMYVFSYNGENNMYKSIIKYDYNGAAHGDELGYIFKINIPGVELPPIIPEDQLVSDRLVTLWTNFAKFQNPTPDLDEVVTEFWTPTSSKKNNVLYIDNDMKMIENPFKKRNKFWTDLLSQKEIEIFKQDFKSKIDFWKNIQKP